MKNYKEITTIKTIDLDTNEESKNVKERQYTIKFWEELTREEKEEKINEYSEAMYQVYQDDLYENFKCELEDIKYRYRDIDFENVYLDSCSQGAWIDSVKNFKYYRSIEIYGETLEAYDIDLHISKYIQKINEDDICVSDYYVETEKLEKMKNTKKYKKFIEEIITEVNNWINDINEACETLITKEYYCPYNLDDEEDKGFLDWYFEDREFVFEKECDE